MSTAYSLQQRLIKRTLGGALVVWVITALVVWLNAQHEVDELLDAHLAQSAALLVLQQTHAPDDDSDTDPDLPILHKYAHRVAYQVFESGQLVMHSPNVSHEPMGPHQHGFRTLTLADGRSWRVFASRSPDDETQLYVAERLSSRNDILGAMLLSVLTPLSLALPLLLAGLWWLLRSELLPLQRLRQALLTRQLDTLDPVALAQAPKEIQTVIDALNDLLERLTRRMETEKRFTANAAHELRTPIAAIRAQAQVALHAGANDSQRQQALQDTLHGCDRASRVIEQLLTLARLDGASDGQEQPLDVSALLQRVVADGVPQALTRGQSVELLAEVTPSTWGNPLLWEILWRNLLDNAMRYSPPGAKVRLRIHTGATTPWAITLEDSGPGLPPEALSRLGERFYRGPVTVDAASGSGLGWSIVQQIARSQGLQLELGRSAELGGLRVQLTSSDRRIAPSNGTP